MKTFENLSNNTRELIRAFLLLLSALFILLDLSSTYWGWLVHGAFIAVALNELLIYWQARRQKATAAPVRATR